MKKILIIGCYGMVGYNIFTILNNSNKYKIFGTCRKGKKHTSHDNIYELNHDEKFDMHNFIDFIKPDVIINCVAQLREKNINEKISMIHANCLIPLYLAEVCDKKNMLELVHIPFTGPLVTVLLGQGKIIALTNGAG